MLINGLVKKRVIALTREANVPELGQSEGFHRECHGVGGGPGRQKIAVFL